MAEESDLDEEKDEIAVEHLDKLFKQIGAKLDERERKFFAGDRLTIADFVILSIYMRFTDQTNKKNVRSQAQAKIDEISSITTYVDKVKTEMASYVAQREGKVI